MEIAELSTDEAYDLLLNWAQTLVNQAKHRSADPNVVNEMHDVLTEVNAALQHVEDSVRRPSGWRDATRCTRPA